MTAGTQRFRSHIVGPVLARLEELGIDVQPLVRDCGLPSDARAAAFVELPLARLHDLLERAGALDPELGVRVGARLSRSTWDVIQLGARSAPTLGAALHRVGRLIPLFNDSVHIDVEEDAGGTSIAHSIPGEPEGLSQYGNEIMLVALLERARDASGVDLSPDACWLAHRAPADRSILERSLRAGSVEYGVGRTGLRLRPEDAARELASADPVLLDVLERLAGPSLAALGGRRGVAARVVRELEARLDGAVPPIALLAKTTGLSERSLQRALAEEATSYRELVDQVRRGKAHALLSAGVPVDDVASRLGYSERSAFVRAFVRWTGRAPD